MNCRNTVRFVDAVKVPVLANITEFGATPLFTTEELAGVGVSIALYPLSAFRAAECGGSQGISDLARRRHTEERHRYHAEPHGSLRLPGLPRVRAEALDQLFESEAD